MKKVRSLLLPIYLIMNVLYIFIGTYLVKMNIINIDKYAYVYIGLLAFNALLIILMFIFKKYRKNKIDIFLLLIIIFGVISTIFAYRRKTAIIGEWGRREGILTISYYMSLLYLCSYVKDKDKKKIIFFILLGGFVEFLYATMQKFGLFNVKTITHEGDIWATGFSINPNFFGQLMIVCLSYSIGLFIESKDKLFSYFIAILIYCYFLGILISNTLSCLLGLMVVMVYLLIYSIRKKKIKKYIIISLLLIFTFTFASLKNITFLKKDLFRIGNESKEIAKGNFKDDYGSGRIQLWKATVKEIPKYMIHGIGVDNFAYILDGKPIRRKTYYYDKAHNEYLQILITMGIFSLISYLCLHFIIIKNGIKKEVYLFLPAIGYLVQAMFNISVIEIAPFFYMTLGFLVDRK